MLEFAWVWLFLVLPLPWLLRRFMPAAAESSQGVVFAPFTASLAHQTTPATWFKKQSAQLWLVWLIWLLLVTAAARPQWLGEAIDIPETGRNLLLAVDVSGSMEEADLDNTGANRLEVVKQVASEFVQRREGDRIGLIFFGSQVFLQAPLTFDRKTVAQWLAEAEIGIAGRETALGDAIGLALKHSKDQSTDTVLILLTDGENTAGVVRPEQAAKVAAEQGLRIHTIGVGGETKTQRGLFGLSAFRAHSDLDEATLKMIAQETGGQYFRATDRNRLAEIYQELDQLEPVTEGSRVVRPVDEMYFWPLGVALLLSFLSAILAMNRSLAT